MPGEGAPDPRPGQVWRPRGRALGALPLDQYLLEQYLVVGRATFKGDGAPTEDGPAEGLVLYQRLPALRGEGTYVRTVENFLARFVYLIWPVSFDVPESELHWVAAELERQEALLPPSTWRRAVYAPDDVPDWWPTSGGEPIRLEGVWSDAGGARSPSDPGALLVAITERATGEGEAMANLVIMAHQYLPRLVREVLRRRRRAGGD